MLLVRASLRPSRIHGIGCFTEEPIARGQVVWVFHRGLDGVLPCVDCAGQPQAVAEFLTMYAFTPVEEPTVLVLCGDHARHINHSPTPNVVRSSRPALYGEYVAAIAIEAGEEITCDYLAFDATGAAKLGG